MDTSEYIDDYEGGLNYTDSYNDSSRSSYSDCDQEDRWLQVFQMVFLPLVYSLVFVLGLAGNGLMVTVLLRRKGSLRITEIYLLHLGLADLLFLSTFPFVVAKEAVGWVFGVFLCKLLSVLAHLNLLCGSLLLACISFDRYLAIVHAIPSVHNRRPRAVHLTCALLWTICLGLSVPEAVFTTVIDHPASGPACSYEGIEGSNWTLLSRSLTHLLGFFAPLAVMGYCYSAVVLTLCRSQRSLEKQGAVRLALLLTAVFCFCWLPYNLTKLLDTLVIVGPLAGLSCDSKGLLMQSLVVSESIGYMHCCLNPILYAFMGVRFRKELLRLLGKWRLCRVCLPAQYSSRTSFSEGLTATTNSKLI